MRSFSKRDSMSASFKSFSQKKSDHLWYHGDCLELLKAIPNETATLVLTSPPYSLKKEYETETGLAELLNFQETVIEESIRILKPDGSICWQIGTYVDRIETVPLDILLYKFFARRGMRLRNRIIWHFEHGMHAKHRFSGRYETILWFTKGEKSTFNLDVVRVPQKQPTKRFYKGPRKGELSCNPLGKNPGDVWKISNIKNGHPEKVPNGHPCQFPVELAERCILALTNAGDVVVDPFGGLATTVVAAIRQGRYGIGAELSKKYYLLGKERISLMKQGKLPVKSIYPPNASVSAPKLSKKLITQL